jgi:hypothetical protein
MQTKITIHVSNQLHLGMFTYIDMTEIKDDVNLFIGQPVIDDKTGNKIGHVVDAQSVKGPVGSDAIEFTLEVDKPIDMFG